MTSGHSLHVTVFDSKFMAQTFELGLEILHFASVAHGVIRVVSFFGANRKGTVTRERQCVQDGEVVPIVVEKRRPG